MSDTIRAPIVLSILMAQGVAYANAWPPMALALFSLPVYATFSTLGIGLALIVVVEAYSLTRSLQMGLGKALWIVGLANLGSTFAGLSLVLLLSTIPFLLPLPLLVVLSVLLAKFTRDLMAPLRTRLYQCITL